MGQDQLGFLIAAQYTPVTRMTTVTKAKLKKSNDQTNIDKYRVDAKITEYHIITRF